MIKKEDCIKIGEVGKTHSLQGAVVVYSDNDLLEQYKEEPVFILLEGAPVPFFVAKDGLMKRNHSSYIIKFDYVDSKAQADRLTGKELLMDKDLVGEEEEEDLPFELSELIGFSVQDILTRESGEVVDVANYSGNMLLSIRIFSKEILLPLSERYVKEISENEQLLRVEIPEEIKELY
ncbi:MULTISPECIES: ribosome maturation factor RimM [Sanguibacteroides]|uniref:Ribosome maturation factor RimM n=1 Tax=Sanguibacteroides justesenii TaxID=1547597 RepID=A0A0C3R4J2_9PORP|nr:MULTISPECIES: ribosome maturation factor RimM [Sanguibacteroides]KIO44345.1 16S rRNA processing protein RimM [Sanguibacteroides justesenii]KIO45398.1 16S rRNA processing protein RimM [Sanguibacteroides justesenii]PXZ44683.1 16S rRNA processing protein RimM [Sanguibacteroides justesenii]